MGLGSVPWLLCEADGGLARVAVGHLGIVHPVLVTAQVELVSRLLLGVLALAEWVEDGAVLCRIDLEGGGLVRREAHETHRTLAVLHDVPVGVLGRV